MGLINRDCGTQIPHPMSDPIRGSDVGPMGDQRGHVPLWDRSSGAHRSWPETTVRWRMSGYVSDKGKMATMFVFVIKTIKPIWFVSLMWIVSLNVKIRHMNRVYRKGQAGNGIFVNSSVWDTTRSTIVVRPRDPPDQ